MNCEYPAYDLDNKLPSVDLIVIAATFSSGVIFEALLEKEYHNVISLEEIIMEEW